MCRNTLSKSKHCTAPIAWASISEHVIKTILYSAFVGNAVFSAQRSATSFSYVVNSLIGVLALWMIQGEVNLAIKRIQRRLPPGYLGFPIIREIKFLLTLARGGVQERIFSSRRKYGPFFSQTFLGQTNVALGGQEELKWLFNNDRKALTDISWPPTISTLLWPRALPNQTGKYHRVLRRLLEPYFTPKFVDKHYLRSMDKITLDELDHWSSSGEYQSSEVFKMYALKIFYVSSFGRVDEDMIVSLHNDFTTWLRGFMSVTTARIPGTMFDEAMKARERIMHTIDKLIDDFMHENPEESERAQTTIIGRLIYGKNEDNNRMVTRDEMKDNLLALIFAGHDTTYASISTLLYHLSQNPSAMKALSDEVSTLSEPLQSEELKNAPVLNACMHESWRLDPPVLGGFRKAKEKFTHKGYTFDKGTTFNYSILMAATDETLYKNHEKFDMRRFLPKDHPLYQVEVDCGVDPLQGRTNYPIFGGGTHMCLGKAFALLELRVLAVRMMKHYEVDVRNPVKAFFPVNGWNVEFKLTPRKDA